jgi:hypothetical protein
LERGAAATHLWHQEGKLGPEARGLHLSPETAQAFAWFCPEEKGFLDHRFTLFASIASDFEDVSEVFYPDIAVAGNGEPSSARPSGPYSILSPLGEAKLRRILARVLDEREFLGPHGIRALSRYSGLDGVRRPAITLLSLLIAQLCLGFVAFLTRVAWGHDAVQPELPMVASTVAHVAVGALLLATTVVLAAQVWLRVPVVEERIPSRERKQVAA